MMGGKVIQGYFVNGRMRLSPTVKPPHFPAPTLQTKPGVCPPGPSGPAFAGRAQIAQAHGAGDAFQVDLGRLGLASGGGRPLPDPVRGKMEAALGADFRNVRVHVGPQAERIGAVAFTLGSDIYFAPGRYQPDTMQGQQVLGHELAHVVQQRTGRVRNPLGAGVAVVQDRALEAEADRLGNRAASHCVVAQPKLPAAMPPSSPIRIPAPVSAGSGSYRLTVEIAGRPASTQSGVMRPKISAVPQPSTRTAPPPPSRLDAQPIAASQLNRSGLRALPLASKAGGPYPIQRQILVKQNQYSAIEAYGELLKYGMFSYQNDDDVKRALRFLAKVHAGPFMSWESLWDAALSLVYKMRERRRRVRRRRMRQRARGILDLTEFRGAEELALQILAQFPQHEYFYIGLGRSPTPVIAYLFRLNRESKFLGSLDKLVINLPLSGFRPLLRGAWSNPHKLDAPLSSSQIKELHKHFDRFLPDIKLIRPRKVLLIDYTQTARALIASAEHLQEYFNQKAGIFGSAPTVVSLALCVKEYLSQVKSTGLSNIIVIPGNLENKASIAYKIGGGDYYDAYAEFGAIYITKGETTEVIGAPNLAFGDLEHDMYVRSKGYEPIP